MIPLQTEAAGAAPPDAFGPFHVLHQAGAGTLGPVFRAFDPDRDRLVAVKVFRLGLSPDRMHQLVAAIERLITVDLRHAAIVAPIAVGTDGIVVYVAQEFVTADSLDVVIRDRGAVAPAVAVGLTAQLAAALDFAAIVDVYHGALHPRDVLVAEDQARLTGLGIARVLERLHTAAPLRRPYSAPERLSGAQWDRRADIFSLAALTHEMLWAKRIAGIGEEAARSLTDLPGGDLVGLRATFARALAERAADRFETALDFAAALRSAFPQVTIAPSVSASDSSDEAARSASGKKHQRLPFDGEIGAATALLRAPDPTRSSPPGVRESPVETSVPSGSSDESKTAETIRIQAEDDRPPGDGKQPRVSDAELSLHAAPSERAPVVDVPLRGAPALKVSEDIWDQKISQPSLKWIERETAPVEYEEAPLFRSVQGDGSRPFWPIGLAIIASLVVGFSTGYIVGGRQTVTPATADAPPASEVMRAADAQSATAPPPAVPQSVAKTESTAPEKASPLVAPAPEQASRPPAAAPVKAEPTPVADARLLVRSVPTGATVMVDGVDRGRTPVTVRGLAPGAHRLRISRDGYVTENQRVEVSRARRPKSIRVALQRTPAAPAGRVTAVAPQRAAQNAVAQRGEVEVQSRPAGAQVFLDGKLIGTTPITTMSAPIGEHALRLERDGYRRWTSSIRVVAGERTRVTASLER